MPPPAHDAAVRLEIARTVLRVTGLTRDVRTWARERYRPFLTSRAARVTVEMASVDRSARMRGRPPRMLRRNGSFALVLGPCRVTGRTGARRVRLTVPKTMSPFNPTIFRLLCSFLLFRERTFLLHASTVVDGGRAFVFCGPSGAGKTTIARLGGRRRVLNDDTIALRCDGDAVRAFATPFFGEGGPAMSARNASAPVAGIFFLRQADAFAHRRLGAAEAVERAMREVYLPKRDAEIAGGLLDALADVVARVPCYELAFARDPAIWDYVRALA